MDRITEEAYYRQRVLKYAAKHGVTKTAERYRMSRKTVHKWKKRYDGTVESLKDRSRAPLHSPLKQKEWEIRLYQPVNSLLQLCSRNFILAVRRFQHLPDCIFLLCADYAAILLFR